MNVMLHFVVIGIGKLSRMLSFSQAGPHRHNCPRKQERVHQNSAFRFQVELTSPLLRFSSAVRPTVSSSVRKAFFGQLD
jgi:hypothetical protein